jgi:hypothetical protein
MRHQEAGDRKQDGFYWQHVLLKTRKEVIVERLHKRGQVDWSG